jgi:hypothetical protein
MIRTDQPEPGAAIAVATLLVKVATPHVVGGYVPTIATVTAAWFGDDRVDPSTPEPRPGPALEGALGRRNSLVLTSDPGFNRSVLSTRCLRSGDTWIISTSLLPNDP